MTVKDGKVAIPRNKMDTLTNMPKSKKFITKLMNNIQHYGCFSNTFADLLYRTKKELKTIGTKFKWTPKLERLIYGLLYVLRYSTGLHLLSHSQMQSAKLCLFVDTNAKAVGCVLAAIIREKIIVPIYSSSKILSKDNEAECSNYTELFGLETSLGSVAQIIGNKKVVVITSSNYAARCFSTMEISTMPQRLKAMVIDIKTRYNITVLHLSPDLNFTANLLSRYFVPSQTGIKSKRQTKKILKMNMKPMILDKNNKYHSFQCAIVQWETPTRIKNLTNIKTRPPSQMDEWKNK